MHGSLELGRPRRRRRWWIPVVLVLLLVAAGPRLAAALPAAAAGLDHALAGRMVPDYEGRLTRLQQENAALRAQVAQGADALAENQALRQLLDCGRTTGSWQPARVISRSVGKITLACSAAAGTPLLDAEGRYAGRVSRDLGNDTCEAVLAGREDPPCAGLCGQAAGLLETGTEWRLTGLPADSGLQAGAVVTTPGGYWLGTLAEAPQPETDGLTAWAPLTDTANLDSTVFFVKKS